MFVTQTDSLEVATFCKYCLSRHVLKIVFLLNYVVFAHCLYIFYRFLSFLVSYFSNLAVFLTKQRKR